MQIEDNRGIRDHLRVSASELGMSYKGVPCLSALEKVLQQSSAEIFVIDGNFPMVVGGEPQNHVAEAIKIVRKHQPDARIVLYSTRGLTEIAEEYHAQYVNKSSGERELATKLKRMISVPVHS